MKYIIPICILISACSTSPLISYDNCLNFCHSEGYKTANYVTIENGRPCEECICYKSLNEAIESTNEEIMHPKPLNMDRNIK